MPTRWSVARNGERHIAATLKRMPETAAKLAAL
jgi:hypothetical protein